MWWQKLLQFLAGVLAAGKGVYYAKTGGAPSSTEKLKGP